MCEATFPPGTPVCVRQTIVGSALKPVADGLESLSHIETEVYGVVESWEDQPAGSWYARAKDNKVWVKRLTLKKADGEVSVLVIDDHTVVAKLEPAAPSE